MGYVGADHYGNEHEVLIVEDNKSLAQLIANELQSALFDVDLLTSLYEAKTALSTTRYAALILDLALPDGDGHSLLHELRKRKDPIPVLVLSARGGLYDRVNSLRCGADDYLVKPFAFEELIARLQALLRRSSQLLGSALEVANVTFDTESRQICIDDKPQFFSARETAVLEVLMQRKGQVVSKKLLEDHIFGLAGHAASNAVEVYVFRLRKQLTEHGARVQIETIRGIGYMIFQDA